MNRASSGQVTRVLVTTAITATSVMIAGTIDKFTALLFHDTLPEYSWTVPARRRFAVIHNLD